MVSKKRIAVDVSPQLYNHLKTCARVASITQGRRVSVSELVRQSIINCLEFDRVRIDYKELDPIQTAMIKTLPI